ncbi:type II secretion system protein GspD [Lysobacter pythonis]|uniref:Type II secretion system protein GspD n=1 Tax=Solilutibacter pythonis TaxID=2483112 RepID=A0A3M2HXD8_9GAMM|nr:type II secretion system secretin GspD [Lysobacter pythonis]RMH90857.1 type II secretion system protein GspD [Lysobacter pythonis]
MTFIRFSATTLFVLLAGCATAPVPDMRRDADLSRSTGVAGTQAAAQESVLLEGEDGPRAMIRHGSKRAIQPPPAPALSGPVRGRGGTSLVFQDEPIQSIIAVILGDMLGQNYVIAPGVQGTVNINTPRPVTQAEALRLLESVLAWNNARLIWADGRYNIVPTEQAVASGLMSPSTGPGSGARGIGYQVRPFELRYISATEMEKILKPYARPSAIVNVDGGRNLITLAGTPTELENYRRTIQTFDVDWMASMSVGVFPLQSGRAAQVVTDLERVFGEQSRTPVAGMFRFMPLEASNSVMVIASQPAYLDDIQQWIDRIDGGASGGRLYTYELKYVKARELAQRLGEVFGGQGGQGAGPAPSIMPGLTPTEVQGVAVSGDAAKPDPGGMGGAMSGGGGLGGGQLSLSPQTQGGVGAVRLQVNGDQVGVAAVEENNALLVRASPAAWKSIREVIQRLDVMPLQVHIEAQVVEVNLIGDLRYGVNWYLENALPESLRAAAAARQGFGVAGGSILGEGTGAGLTLNFLGTNVAAVLTALDKVTDFRLLQTPSIVVKNNAEATLNVGSRIPVASVSVNPGVPGGGNTYSQVQYLDTGTILKVRPRVTRDGMVFLDIVQEVSSPGSQADIYGNVRINTRRMKTEAAVQSGDTVMLAGLISDEASKGTSGVPFLSRLPVIGGLFGVQTDKSTRTEVIVLLTPRLLRNPAEARALTDEYGRRFKGLEPIRRAPSRKPR